MGIFTTHQGIKDTIAAFFERDIRKLMEEISLYKEESSLWMIQNGTANSAGNLCMHLTGNLNHFIGAVIGKNGYIRNRDNEFAAKNISRDLLISELEKTLEMITTVLGGLKDKDLEKDFPVEKHGRIVSTGHMLLHLLSHFNYHLGQVNFHRRITQGEE